MSFLLIYACTHVYHRTNVLGTGCTHVERLFPSPSVNTLVIYTGTLQGMIDCFFKFKINWPRQSNNTGRVLIHMTIAVPNVTVTFTTGYI